MISRSDVGYLIASILFVGISRLETQESTLRPAPCRDQNGNNLSVQELKVPLPLKVATGRGRLPLKLQVKSDKRFIGQTATALEEYKQEWEDC